MSESAQALLDPGSAFELFHDRIGRWCVRRLDGLVFGVFRERKTAVRFVTHECRGAKRPTLIDKTNDGSSAICTKNL